MNIDLPTVSAVGVGILVLWLMFRRRRQAPVFIQREVTQPEVVEDIRVMAIETDFDGDGFLRALTIRVSYLGMDRLHAYVVGWNHDKANPVLTVFRGHYTRVISDELYAQGDQKVREAALEWIAQNNPK